MRVSRLLYLVGFTTMGPPSPDSILLELVTDDEVDFQIWRVPVTIERDEDDIRRPLAKAFEELAAQLRLSHGEPFQ